MSKGSDRELPKEAQTAWDAYREMGISKSVYFEFLQQLDEKYKDGGSPAIAENLKLEELLKIHDEKVTAFNIAMQEIEDKNTRELLLEKLSADTTLIGMH